MIDATALPETLASHLPKQRWFAGTTVGEVRVLTNETLRKGRPGLEHVVVDVDGARWQLVLGLRETEDSPQVEGDVVLGVVPTDDGDAIAYDATHDPELAIELLRHVAPGEAAAHARPLLAEQTNTSVVYDERLILKLFRRLADGPNPDAEVTRALATVGFPNVAAPVAEWRVGDVDLAVVNQFLAGGTDGFNLALTSLRDLFDRGGEPDQAGGDLAPEARRLGIVTAKLHLALAEAFGTAPGDPRAWADDMDVHLARVDVPPDLAALVRVSYDQLRSVADPGPALRIHGDYHLGQVLRTDAGWYVLDFEGEPARPLEERRRPSSPMKDVAGMVRSFHYAASVALREWGEDAGEEIVALADAWEQHNAFAFVEGYLAADGVEAVLPADDADREAVRRAFELDKAVYEVGYEEAHRPDWASIPRAAVARLVGG